MGGQGLLVLMHMYLLTWVGISRMIECINILRHANNYGNTQRCMEIVGNDLTQGKIYKLSEKIGNVHMGQGGGIFGDIRKKPKCVLYAECRSGQSADCRM